MKCKRWNVCAECIVGEEIDYETKMTLHYNVVFKLSNYFLLVHFSLLGKSLDRILAVRVKLQLT